MKSPSPRIGSEHRLAHGFDLWGSNLTVPVQRRGRRHLLQHERGAGDAARYTLVNGGRGLRIHDTLQLYGRVENALDETTRSLTDSGLQ